MRKVVALLVATAFFLLTPMTALADYTASVAYKDAPTYDEDSVVVSDPEIQDKILDHTLKLEITSISKVDETQYEEIRNILNNAFGQIKDKQVEDLFPDLEEGLRNVLGPDVSDEEIKELLDKLVVTDLFDMSLVDPSKTQVVKVDKSETFTVALDLGLTQDDVFLIYHEEETGKWVVVPYEWLENGMVKITCKGLSAFAVLMPAEPGQTIIPSGNPNPEPSPEPEPSPTPDNPASEGSSGTTNTLPNGSTGSTTGSNVSTGVSSTPGTLFVIGAVAAAAGIFFVVKAKKKID